MKKFIIGLFVAIASLSAFADVSTTLSTIHDVDTHKNGARVEVIGSQIGLVQPTASAAIVYSEYQRYTIGVQAPVTTYGPVSFAITGGLGYQDNYANSPQGVGISIGAKASYKLTKSFAIDATVEKWMGQERVAARDGNIASLGLNYTF